MPEMKYEFHITQQRSDILNLNLRAKGYPQKVSILGVDNLDREGCSIRTDWMACNKAVLQGGHSSALHYLFNLQQDLGFYHRTTLAPIRMKIEVEYAPDLDPEEYAYIETHYPISEEDAQNRRGISINLISGYFVATERCYNPSQFHEFARIHHGKRVELCLYDDRPRFDFEGGWLKSYKGATSISEKSQKALSNDLGKLFN
jgi:hypothetical protein